MSYPLNDESGPVFISLFTGWCSRQESNLHYKLRKLASYPLNDESN